MAPLQLLVMHARLLAAVPPQLLRGDAIRLMPWLLEALRRMQVIASFSCTLFLGDVQYCHLDQLHI